MFDLERYLVTNGVDAKCAHVILVLFGDSLTQKKLSDGKVQDHPGWFELDGLTIHGDHFAYTKENEVLDTMTRMNSNLYTSVTFIDGTLTLGELMTNNHKSITNGNIVSSPEIHYIVLPKYKENEGIYEYYDNGSVEDYLDTFYPGRDPNNSKQMKEVVAEVLCRKEALYEGNYNPDKTGIFEQGKSYDEMLESLKKVIRSPHVILSENEFISENEEKKTL